MVWVPPRKQRAQICKRFADLANTSRAAKISSTQIRSGAAESSTAEAVPSAACLNNHSTWITAKPKEPPVETLTSAQPTGEANSIVTPRRNDPEELTVHHIPPVRAQVYTRKRVTRKVHEAYHLIFGPSPTFEACLEILRRDWWPNRSVAMAEDCSAEKD